jgi:hypothetical protein
MKNWPWWMWGMFFALIFQAIGLIAEWVILIHYVKK